MIGLVENMSHIICPECGTQINVFGTSKADNTARMIQAAMLAHIPLDPRLAELCDQGAIEDYESELFAKIAKTIVGGKTNG